MRRSTARIHQRYFSVERKTVAAYLSKRGSTVQFRYNDAMRALCSCLHDREPDGAHG
jgi:hypothetical protein